MRHPIRSVWSVLVMMTWLISWLIQLNPWWHHDVRTLPALLAHKQRDSIVELWCFLCYLPRQVVEQTGMRSETPWRSCDDPVMSCNFDWKVTCTTYFLGAAICPDERTNWHVGVLLSIRTPTVGRITWYGALIRPDGRMNNTEPCS